MPEATLRAFGDHGDPARRFDQSAAWAERTLRPVEAAGIDLAAVTADLERDGVRSFCDSYRRLLDRIETTLDRTVVTTLVPSGRVVGRAATIGRPSL
jgi:transaldolase